jgi:cytochrome c556
MVAAASGLAIVAVMGVGVGAGQAQDAAVIDKAMKAVGPAFGALRKSVEGGMAPESKAAAETLSKAFADTEAFFKSHGKADGVELAQAAKKGADALAAGASGDAAKASMGELGKTCAGCHAKYRDRAADGSYGFKPGN